LNEADTVCPCLRSIGAAVGPALVILIGAAASTPFGRAQDASAGAAAGANDLLRAAPFDRITLTDGTVVVVEPVSPRPLPVIDPKDKKRNRGTAAPIPEEGNIIVGVPTKLELPGSKKDVAPDGVTSDEIRLHLIHGGPNEVRDFKVKRANIKTVEYFENMLLQECNRLLTVHDYARAFECCLRVQNRNPGWAGLDGHVNRVLFAEGRKALIDGDSERGLRLLVELLGRKRDYPGLFDQIGGAYTKRIERALKMGLYARGRRVLHELEELVPEHILVKQMRALYISKAKQFEHDTEGLSGPERLDGLTEALRIWPELEGAAALYNTAFAAEPTLTVAVTDVAVPLGPWVRTPADARISRLLYRPILASDDDDGRKGKHLGQLAAAIESTDLGRRLLIRVRSGFYWSDGSRPVSAIDLARDLVDRTDPHSPRYEARWADLLDRVEMTDQTRVEIRLNHVPIKLGFWLLGPVGAAHAGIDGRVATSSQDRPLVSNAAYRCFTAAADRVELRLRDDHVGSSGGEAKAVDRAALGSGGEASGGQSKGPAGEAKVAAGEARDSAVASEGAAGETDGAAGAAKVAGGEPAAAVPKIRRICEVRLAPGDSAVGALRRGDVSMVDHVPPVEVAGLAGFQEIKVGRYSRPVVHLIALDGRNPALRNRALRRALSYAIDRKGLLEDYVLKHAATSEDAVADGAFPKGSYADAPAVKPLEVHLWLAKMLVAAARKELGGPPIRLELEYPGIPEVKAIVEKLAESFRAAGVEIVTTEVLRSRLEAELRAGRRFDMAYRVLRCDEPIFDAGMLLCPGYDAPPEANALASAVSPRILQLLMQLERASEWPSARGLALQIDRESRDELPVIPLWQLVDHYAWRDRLQGPAASASELYHGIETWEILPWIATDRPPAH
jgi:peptide/nickel transport system substrate-binding protein